MANHGYCQNCWWHKDGVCFMQSVETKDESYCPDYANRDKLNKKGTPFACKVGSKRCYT